MNRRDYVRKVTDTLRENNIKKPIHEKKHVFHISDDEGNSRDFTVRQKDRNTIYTIEDVEKILDTSLAVLEELLKSGDSLSLRGYYTIGLRYRPAKVQKDNNGEWTEIPAGYYPRFTTGNYLKRSAKLYWLSQQDKLGQSHPEPVEGDDSGDRS